MFNKYYIDGSPFEPEGATLAICQVDADGKMIGGVGYVEGDKIENYKRQEVSEDEFNLIRKSILSGADTGIAGGLVTPTVAAIIGKSGFGDEFLKKRAEGKYPKGFSFKKSKKEILLTALNIAKEAVQSD